MTEEEMRQKIKDLEADKAALQRELEEKAADASEAKQEAKDLRKELNATQQGG